MPRPALVPNPLRPIGVHDRIAHRFEAAPQILHVLLCREHVHRLDHPIAGPVVIIDQRHGVLARHVYFLLSTFYFLLTASLFGAGAFAKNSSCTALTPRSMSSSAITHDMVISDELMQSTLIFSLASAANMRPDRPGVAASREPIMAMVA